jgi:hypothetical protein
MLRRPLSNTTYRHLRRTLHILNRRLAETDAYKHDILLYVVGILALIAVRFGHYNTAKIHAAGLSEIIRLRGGFTTLNNIPLIQLTIDRYDPLLHQSFLVSILT